MARILFTTWEGGGHVQPMLLVASGLKDRGHEVLVLSDVCNAPDAAAFDLPFRAWRTAPSRPDKTAASDLLRDWEAQTPLESIQRLCDRLMVGPAALYAGDVLDVLKDFPADLIVSQELLFGVMMASEKAGVPLALLTANIWSFPTLAGVPPFGTGFEPARTDDAIELQDGLRGVMRQLFDMALPALNEARGGLGLPALAHLFDQLDMARKILLGTSPVFDFAPSPVPEPFVYVGPYLADPVDVQPWTSPWPADDKRPLIVVTSSSLYEAQEDVLQRVIAALAGMEVRAVVTLGPALDPAHFSGTENVRVVRSAPHGALFEQAAAVVTHGGHGSVLRPMIAGKPQLVIPSVRDQRDNAVRVTHRRCGLSLERQATSEQIADALGEILESVMFRTVAELVAAELKNGGLARTAEAEIEKLL